MGIHQINCVACEERGTALSRFDQDRIINKYNIIMKQLKITLHSCWSLSNREFISKLGLLLLVIHKLM